MKYLKGNKIKKKTVKNSHYNKINLITKHYNDITYLLKLPSSHQEKKAQRLKKKQIKKYIYLFLHKTPFVFNVPFSNSRACLFRAGRVLTAHAIGMSNAYDGGCELLSVELARDNFINIVK